MRAGLTKTYSQGCTELAVKFLHRTIALSKSHPAFHLEVIVCAINKLCIF